MVFEKHFCFDLNDEDEYLAATFLSRLKRKQKAWIVQMICRLLKNSGIASAENLNELTDDEFKGLLFNMATNNKTKHNEGVKRYLEDTSENTSSAVATVNNLEPLSTVAQQEPETKSDISDTLTEEDENILDVLGLFG